MISLIAKFWMRRFLIVTAISIGLLVIVEFIKHSDNPDFVSVLIWGLVSGAVAATTGTWWARSRGCGLPQAK